MSIIVPTSMKSALIALGAVLLIAACGPAGGGQTSTGSNSGSATIDLTVSGDFSGTSTQLSKSSCADASVAPSAKTFVIELYPVIGGKTYDAFLQIKKWTGGAVALTLPADQDKVFMTFTTADNSGSAWTNDSDTSGTVNVAADLGSGDVDVKAMSTTSNTSKVDVKYKFTCPATH